MLAFRGTLRALFVPREVRNSVRKAIFPSEFPASRGVLNNYKISTLGSVLPCPVADVILQILPVPLLQRRCFKTPRTTSYYEKDTWESQCRFLLSSLQKLLKCSLAAEHKAHLPESVRKHLTKKEAYRSRYVDRFGHRCPNQSKILSFQST